MRFRGQELAALPMHERAWLGLAMAWQEPARIEGLPVWTYLTLSHSAVNPAEVLRRVGLTPEIYLDRLVGKTLSGGSASASNSPPCSCSSPPWRFWTNRRRASRN
jgi:Fe-S cluster assembly ATP-binding protein